MLGPADPAVPDAGFDHGCEHLRLPHAAWGRLVPAVGDENDVFRSTPVDNTFEVVVSPRRGLPQHPPVANYVRPIDTSDQADLSVVAFDSLFDDIYKNVGRGSRKGAQRGYCPAVTVRSTPPSDESSRKRFEGCVTISFKSVFCADLAYDVVHKNGGSLELEVTEEDYSPEFVRRMRECCGSATMGDAAVVKLKLAGRAPVSAQDSNTTLNVTDDITLESIEAQKAAGGKVAEPLHRVLREMWLPGWLPLKEMAGYLVGSLPGEQCLYNTDASSHGGMRELPSQFRVPPRASRQWTVDLKGNFSLVSHEALRDTVIKALSANHLVVAHEDIALRGGPIVVSVMFATDADAVFAAESADKLRAAIEADQHLWCPEEALAGAAAAVADGAAPELVDQEWVDAKVDEATKRCELELKTAQLELERTFASWEDRVATQHRQRLAALDAVAADLAAEAQRPEFVGELLEEALADQRGGARSPVVEGDADSGQLQPVAYCDDCGIFAQLDEFTPGV